jgi:hypothetical protein
MNRRAFFSLLPAAPIGALMAAEAMAKAPPVSMAPDKALMTLAAHKPPPPPRDPFTFAPLNHGSFTVYDKGDGEWYKELIKKHKADGNFFAKSQLNNFVTTSHSSNIILGEGFKVESAPGQFDEETKVAMSVGKDGHLWLKINHEWKRIVTE